MMMEQVGGSMGADEARALIRKADMDKNGSIDFSEFETLWTSLKGGEDVCSRISMSYLIDRLYLTRKKSVMSL